jgi:ABC-type transporter Mla subunit MlaD
MGGLIVIGIVLFTLFVFFIPDIYRRLTPSVEIIAVMPLAGTLDKASEVWIAGQQVGTVLSVELRPGDVDSAERVAVRMSIPRRHIEHVRRDSEVRVTSARLIGEPVLDIRPGSPGQPVIRAGDTLRVRTAGSLAGLLDRTFRVTESIRSLSADLASIERVAGTARQRELARLNRSLSGAFTEFRALMTTLESTPMRTLSGPEFRTRLERLGTQSTELSEALRNAAQRARRAQSDMQPVLTRLAARGDTIRGVLADIQSRIDEGGGGLLIRAQRDSAIFRAIHEAQLQLDSLIAETTRNPLRFWF